MYLSPFRLLIQSKYTRYVLTAAKVKWTGEKLSVITGKIFLPAYLTRTEKWEKLERKQENHLM